MKPLRFGIYAGIVWSLASAILITISAINGMRYSWVELDFRTLTAVVMLAADAAGHGRIFETIIEYAELGMPMNAFNVIVCLALAAVDGFVSGVIIALVYNALAGRRTKCAVRKALYFGAGAGIALGLASFLLSAVMIEYGSSITEFDFTIRPAWLAFHFLPGLFPEALRDSYMLFPAGYRGALAWAAWGFLDGLVWGSVLAFICIKIRSVIVK